MLAPTASVLHRPSPLPSALLLAEPGPVVMADDPCEAAFAGATPTGPRKYYRARYYDPKIGRFISEDPLGFDDGVNFYTYVANNPVKFLDPLGLMKIVICQRQHTLTLYDDKGTSLMNAPVKCGCTKTPTPTGTFQAGQWQSEPTDPRFSGPNGWSKDPWGNPYGPYYLPIGPTGCGIHGPRGSAWLGNLFINVPDFDIENLCSHGCVRLSNPNITQLHQLVAKPKGTSIVIKDSCE